MYVWHVDLHIEFNRLRDNVFRGSIKMHLLCMLFLHSDMVHVTEILPHVRQGYIYPT